jgi:hypothetical protein
MLAITNKSRARQAQAQAKAKCRTGGKPKRHRPRNQTQGASEHKNPLANAARKLSRAFATAYI